MSGLRNQYLYKISRRGRFLGVIKDQVQTPFTYNQNLYSAGAQLQITVDLSADTSRDEVDFLMTEDGDFLMTEDGDFQTTERTDDIVGNTNSQALIRNNNDVEVYEFSDNYPNGNLVFAGYISKWNAIFGGAGIVVTILSYGAELDNYLIQGGDTVDQSQAASDSTKSLTTFGKEYDLPGEGYQSIVIGGAVTSMSGMEWKIKGNSASDVGKYLQLDIYGTQSDAENNINSLGSAVLPIASTSETIHKFVFAVPIVVTAGAAYYAKVSNRTAELISYSLSYQSTSPYAAGIARTHDSSIGGGGFGWADLAGDFYFKTYYTAGATSVPFTSQDPGAIVKSIIDSYRNRGGLIGYSAATVDLTGDSVSHTFKINTILEGIKMALVLSPADWYWYVDVATNLLYFKETSPTAEHTFIKGVHLETINVEATIENVKNIVYFSGGDTGSGENLFTTDSDLDSLSENRVGIARLSNNRVVASPEAEAVMQSFLGQNSEEQYNTTISILKTTYDISSIEPGQVIGFEGFGTMVDRLLLQVVGRKPEADRVTLTLGVMQKRSTKTIDDILRALNDIQTSDNPDTPT